MRRIISILLLLILAINWLGLDMVFTLMNAKAHRQLENKIEAGDYDANQLIELKVDLQLPYATDWASFEKTSGTIVVEGVVYHFVERKYENGQMTYRCIPNYKGTQLQSAREYFHNLAYEMEKQDKKDPAPKPASAKKLSLETTVIEKIEWCSNHIAVANLHSAHLPKAKMDGFGTIPSQPPDA